MPPSTPSPGDRGAPTGRGARAVLVLLLLVLGGSSVAAAVRTSTTFDEIVLVAAGARALETESWSMVVDQPPVMPFLYGLPVWASGPTYPSEVRERMWTYDDRWEYARAFYFGVGNDPERIALLSRLVAIALALVLVGATYAYGAWMEGPRTGLLAAFLVALLPDVVAHGAVAYNDVPMALAYLLAVWALDAAIRRPTAVRGALAGVAVAATVGVKFSALALGPVAVLLLLVHAVGRDRTRPGTRGRDLALATGVGIAAAYALLVLMYRGDVWLVGLEYGFRFTVEHASEGHPAPAWLLGETSPDGWWYFFPLAFLVKTPAALHLLMPLAAVGLWWGGRRARARAGAAAVAGVPGDGPGGTRRRGWPRQALRSRARGPAVGAAVFAGFLLASSLDVGFRYALPALPPLLLLTALGVSRLWTLAGSRRRAGLALLLALYAGSTLSAFPWFLAYRSEWFRPRPPGEEALLDSSVDWGQGLLALRDWMEEEGVERVRLSYFGSALPSGYGIRYEALPSFLRLPDAGGAAGGGAGAGSSGAGVGVATAEGPGDATRGQGDGWTVVSATNLHGLYLPGDPFAGYRAREPERVLAGSLYVYR